MGPIHPEKARINFVTNYPKIMLNCEINNGLNFFGSVNRSSWIVWGIKQDGFRPVRYGGTYRFYNRMKEIIGFSENDIDSKECG